MIDYEMCEWAERNLRPFELDGESVDPLTAAYQVVESEDLASLVPDELGIGPEFRPQFTDEDMVALREVRRSLGKDIDYLDSSLPQLSELPDADVITELHQDLSQLERLRRVVENGEVPALADSRTETLQLAQALLSRSNCQAPASRDRVC